MLLRCSAVLTGSKPPFPSEWKLSLALSALFLSSSIENQWIWGFSISAEGPASPNHITRYPDCVSWELG